MSKVGRAVVCLCARSNDSYDSLSKTLKHICSHEANCKPKRERERPTNFFFKSLRIIRPSFCLLLSRECLDCADRMSIIESLCFRTYLCESAYNFTWRQWQWNPFHSESNSLEFGLIFGPIRNHSDSCSDLYRFQDKWKQIPSELKFVGFIFGFMFGFLFRFVFGFVFGFMFRFIFRFYSEFKTSGIEFLPHRCLLPSNGLIVLSLRCWWMSEFKMNGRRAPYWYRFADSTFEDWNGFCMHPRRRTHPCEGSWDLAKGMKTDTQEHLFESAVMTTQEQ